MNRAEWRVQGGEILIWQRPSVGVALLRYALGAPMFLLGLYFAWLLVEGPLSFFRAEGASGLLSALPGMAVSLVLAAAFLPLGGWMLLMRKRWRIDLLRRQAVNEIDWRIGRKAIATPLEHFDSLKVSIDVLDRGSSKPSRTLAALVELMPTEADQQAALELAWFDRKARDEARRCANELATRLGLPLTDQLDDELPKRKRRR